MATDPRWVEPLEQLIYAVLDFETTGLRPDIGDQICEVGLVKVQEGTVIEEFSRLINPRCPISYGAFQVHGITTEMVANEPPIEDVLPDLIARLEGSVLATYNAPFELSFLHLALIQSGLTFPPVPCLDLLELARCVVSSPRGYSLEKVAIVLGVLQPGLHRALADAHTAARVWQAMMRKVLRKGCRNLTQMQSRYGYKVVFEFRQP